MIDPGRLRERITIQKASDVRNPIGETTLKWSDYAERWASVESIGAREFLLSGQQHTEVTHRIRMRHLDGLESTMRVVWRGRTLEIMSVLDQNNRSEHEMLCTERAE